MTCNTPSVLLHQNSLRHDRTPVSTVCVVGLIAQAGHQRFPHFSYFRNAHAGISGLIREPETR